jgi:alpha-beta hydrolase superfamily lysophospholipase
MWPRCSGARTKDSTGYEVGTFNDDTRPTSAQVLTLIDQAVADVQAGYAAVTPSWPDDPETIDEARAHTEVFAGKTLGQVADHVAEVVGALTTKPVVMGHSTGGLLAQMIADRGLSAATWSSTRGPSGASCRSRSRRRAPRLRC